MFLIPQTSLTGFFESKTNLRVVSKHLGARWSSEGKREGGCSALFPINWFPRHNRQPNQTAKQRMLPASIRTSSCLTAASLLVSAALFLHLALPEATTGSSAVGPAAVVSPQNRVSMSGGSTAGRWRAHEVGGVEGARRGGVKKFVLQESSGSGSGAEPSWRTLSFKEVAGQWKSGGELVQTIATCIKEVDFPAVFWESAPVTRSTTVGTMEQRLEIYLCGKGAAEPRDYILQLPSLSRRP